ncbi:MAG TPA: oligopeptide/dipeptide ABC transporter ATP-binding protein, partial [Thermodesulfobacteriota bacterium]|nr:oligopeptide/dipeptide ABC transporter ATP-binding protein [Thermodesulfobacteriota bacterium]
PLIRTENLKKSYRLDKGFFRGEPLSLMALGGINLLIYPGETLGVVGESGCGKSTLGKLILRLEEPSEGKIFFENREITGLKAKEIRPLRRQMQVIFQDPYASLNPRIRVGKIIEEPLSIYRVGLPGERRKKVEDLLSTVGLSNEVYDRYPHEFSGGQRQRIGIARALALRPKLIIADEPVSALDVSIQAQIINLILDLQNQFALTYLFISHDLQVVSHVSDRIAVMYAGKMVELGTRSDFLNPPWHPYTEMLWNSVPGLDREKKEKEASAAGEIPDPLHLPSGCVFHPRCPYRQSICNHEEPLFRESHPGYRVACHFR